jgi:Zn-dependent metalloprotease
MSKKLRWMFLAVCLGAVLFVGPAQAGPKDVATLSKTLRAPGANEPARSSKAEDGALTFLGAPPGGYFDIAHGKASDPAAVAKSLITEHGGALGIESDQVAFETSRIRHSDTRSSVKLNQTYQGLPVFGAQVNVQVNRAGGVECMFSDIWRDTTAFDEGDLSLVPAISQVNAAANAIKAVIDLYDQDDLETAGDPELLIYDPSVLGRKGPACLAWRVVVQSASNIRFRYAVFINAANGESVLRYSLVPRALNRMIYDADNTFPSNFIGTLVRSEGQPPVSIADANSAYDYFGDTYDFYKSEHDRDSINDKGLPLSGTVRFCLPYDECPLENAFFVTGPLGDPIANRMYFGEGFVADDVVAHELTHGVTSFESNLIYADESGALNEMMSDIFGEFVDLSNGRGTDTPEVRWMMGEDTPLGAVRSLQDVANPAYGNWFYPVIDYVGDTPIVDYSSPFFLTMPDRYKGPGWYEGPLDEGGVHHNCGVGLKLCYLLTDGAEFNGWETQGMGIPKVADLFYECQTNLLLPAADYSALYNALGQAAINLGFNGQDRLNIEFGCTAVEIADWSGKTLRQFRAMPTAGGVELQWQNPSLPGFSRVVITRHQSRFPNDPIEGTLVYEGLGTPVGEGLLVGCTDAEVTPGQEYYYSIFAEFTAGWYPLRLYSRTIASEGSTNGYLSEHFSALDQSLPDLAYRRIEFTPVVDMDKAIASGQSDSYFFYGNYVVRINDPVAEPVMGLPVSRANSVLLPLYDDEVFPVEAANLYGPIPLFGRYYDEFIIGANGYIAPREAVAISWDGVGYYVDDFLTLEWPVTLGSHFEIPRISPLYADLLPWAGGQVWVKSLPEKLVVTWEGVPAYGEWLTNTVQVELHYNGRIAFTYGQLGLEASTVIGLSDGKGVPIETADLTEEVSAADGVFRIDAIPPVYAQMGEIVQFTVRALNVPAGSVVTYSMAWPDGQIPDLATINPETGEFAWPTTSDDAGSHRLRVLAQAAGAAVSQEVFIYLTSALQQPAAANLQITWTGDPFDEPGDNAILYASYDYVRPTDQSGGDGGEGDTILYWFQNGVSVFPLANQREVPPFLTAPGDEWSFAVVPRTRDGREGPSFMSEIVTIREESEASTPALEMRSDVNGDGKVNVVDVQLVVNAVLGRDIGSYNANVNGDDKINASDVQFAVRFALSR